jgi:hypothetical protein
VSGFTIVSTALQSISRATKTIVMSRIVGLMRPDAALSVERQLLTRRDSPPSAATETGGSVKKPTDVDQQAAGGPPRDERQPVPHAPECHRSLASLATEAIAVNSGPISGRTDYLRTTCIRTLPSRTFSAYIHSLVSAILLAASFKIAG